MLSIIVAKAKNNVIGKDNKMIWHLPEDMKRFRKITENHVIIMGRKTFESLGKVLPNRKHVVMTHSKDLRINDENVEIVNSIDELKKYIDSNEECFLIGGAMMYNLLMPYTNKIYMTELDKNFEGDTVFPKLDENKWKEIEREEGTPDGINNFKYEFVTYVRK